MVKENDNASLTQAGPQDDANPRRFGPLEYLIVNLVFIAFCGLQFVVIKAITGEQIGLFFFFGVIVLGFIAVSVFMYVYDLIAEDTEGDEASVADSGNTETT